MFEIRALTGKGLGVVTTRLIPRGTCIFAEKPLLRLHAEENDSDVYAAFANLPRDKRARYIALSTHAPRQTLLLRWALGTWYHFKGFALARPFALPHLNVPKRVAEHVRVLSVFRTNVFECDAVGFSRAVFDNVSRLNHSCTPNTCGIWNENLGKFTVRATRDVREGEELTLSYLCDEGGVRDVRHARLSGYGFECNCPVCDMHGARGRENERLREGMAVRLAEWVEQGEGTGLERVRAELGILNGFLQLFEMGGAAGREVAEM